MKHTLFVYHEQWSWENTGKIVVFNFRREDETAQNPLRVFLREIEVELPDIELLTEAELKQIMVDGYRKEKEIIQAETHQKLKAIDEKIQSLLAITFEG